MINKNKLHVIEIAGRLSGGNFSSIMIPKSVGVNLVKCAIKLATNSAIKIKDLKIKYNKNISQRFFFTNKTGTLKEYNFPSWAKKSKKLVFFDFNYNKGDEIKKITNHTNRLGQIIVTDEIQKKTIQLAKHIIKKTKFVIV